MAEPSPPAPAVRVFVIDDHEVFRRAAAAVVEATDGFVVVGTAESFEAAEAAVHDVDLVLLDIHLPGMSGIEAARRLAEGGPRPAVVLISTYDESTFDWADTGAVDYVAKSSFSSERLLRAWGTTRR
jgi:DNA-binding NarL/FixJ family response regulator